MDIFKLLDELDELVESSTKIPLSGKIMIDKDELMSLIEEMRIAVPEELKQAEWIKEEKQRIISEAQVDADKMLKDVQIHIENMVDNHEIVSEAEKRAEEILNRAQISAREVRSGAREYADDIISNVEESLKDISSRMLNTVEHLEKNRTELNQSN